MVSKTAVVLGAAVLALGIPSLAWAQDIPPDCLASFNVDPDKVTADLGWVLATGQSTVLACASGELLREKLFVEGDATLGESDLGGTPAEAQSKAVEAFDTLHQRIQELPGDDAPGTLFAAFGYLVAKYKLASCILTAEEAGGTCWVQAAAFITGTYKFFHKVSADAGNQLNKQELLQALDKLKPEITHGGGGDPDLAGARLRWVTLQTNLCRAIQQDCL